jgi:PAS domain S-box-containing protein
VSINRVLRVLLVDDSAEVATWLETALREQGGFAAHVEQVATPEALCAALNHLGWHLVISEVRLAHFTGEEVLALMRRQGLHLPFFFLCDQADEAAELWAVRAGAQDCLPKGNALRLVAAVEREYRMVGMFRELQRRTAALRHSEAQFRLLIENSSDIVFLVSPRGCIRYGSPAVERILGYTPGEYLGRSALEAVHPDDVRAVQRALVEARRRGQPRLVEHRLRHRDGDWRVFESAIKVQSGVEKDVPLIVTARDITERRQVEMRLRQLSRAVEHSPASIVITNAAGEIEYVNPKFTQVTGYTLAEVLGQNPRLLKSGETPPETYRQLWHAITHNQEWRGELHNRRKSGELFWEWASISAITNDQGAVTHFVAVKEDITERKQRNRELEAIAQVSTALRTASTRAEMLPIICEQLTTLLEASGAALALRDGPSGDSTVELGSGVWSGMTGARLSPQEGICGHVIATGQPYINADVRRDPRFYKPALVDGAHAVACVPLIAQDYTLGTLGVGRAAPFTASEVQVLTLVGNIAANAIRRATLHEQTEQHVQRLLTLHAVDMAIASNFDLRYTLDVLLTHITVNLNVDAADVLLLNRETQTLSFAAGMGFRSEALQHTRLRVGEGHAGRAALLERVVSIPNLPEAGGDFVRSPMFATEGFVSYFGVPLVVKSQVIGVMEILQRAPFNPERDWLEFMETLAQQAAIAIENAQLFGSLQRSHTELALAYDTTLEGWSRALDLRDHETEGHTRRVTEMTLRLATAMGLDDGHMLHMRRGALLHDIGKMGIPDNILLKPGPLTDEEWEIMRRHPDYAYHLLKPIQFLRSSLDIPYCHHEKWDGTGYPRGLKGEEIPLAARIFAIADVWDALRSDRPYRSGWPEEQVRDYIRTRAGTHFDPRAVDAFLSLPTASLPYRNSGHTQLRLN